MLVYVCLYIDIEMNVFFGDCMHVIQLSMIHGKMYGLYYAYGIHYICGMKLTCNGASHCICTGKSHFMGVSAWLKSNTTVVIDEWNRYRFRSLT